MGIAKFISGDKPIVDSSGTPGYMSPEVITNNPHDFSCDFYAIGIMVHEFMFTKVNNYNFMKLFRDLS
jgi:serine/threonine protein kinase